MVKLHSLCQQRFKIGEFNAPDCRFGESEHSESFLDECKFDTSYSEIMNKLDIMGCGRCKSI